MAQLALQCPYCRTEKIGFAYRYHVIFRPGIPSTRLFMQCEGCGECIVAVVDGNPDVVSFWTQGQYAVPGTIVRVLPTPEAQKSPADVPVPVQSAYLSGLDNLGRRRGANAAAIMFRRAVEIAVKTINPDGPKGDNLKTRIEGLPPEVVTPAMKKWAHRIRLEANDAAHDTEEFSEEDAKQLHVFAEMFLTYAFTLPAMLKRATESDGKQS